LGFADNGFANSARGKRFGFLMQEFCFFGELVFNELRLFETAALL
jgi:hypothetical protein